MEEVAHAALRLEATAEELRVEEFACGAMPPAMYIPPRPPKASARFPASAPSQPVKR